MFTCTFYHVKFSKAIVLRIISAIFLYLIIIFPIIKQIKGNN